MSLSQQDRDVIDELQVSLACGDEPERRRACLSLDALRRSSPEHRDYIDTQHAADDRINIYLSALRYRYPRYLTRPSDSRSFWNYPARSWIVAGSLALSALTALWMFNPELSHQDGVSAIGQQQELTLADGTHVLLNTGSSIHFSNRLRSREIVLEQGEALFSVVHSALRPSHVRAREADIVDVGTQFSVRLRQTGIDVAVLEGQVIVSLADRPQPVDLNANQAIRTDGTQVMPQLASTLTAWKDRRLIFDHASLSQVVDELQRYASFPIRLVDVRAAQTRISGGFSSTDPRELIKILPTVAPVSVQFGPDGTARIASR